MKKKRLISVIVAGGLATTGLAITAAMAQASAPIPCSVKKDTGKACVIVRDNSQGHVHSVRVNGQCLTWTAKGPDHYYGTVTVNRTGDPLPHPLPALQHPVQTYSGYHCEGNAENTLYTFQAWADKSGKDTNFRRMVISPVPGFTR